MTTRKITIKRRTKSKATRRSKAKSKRRSKSNAKQISSKRRFIPSNISPTQTYPPLDIPVMSPEPLDIPVMSPSNLLSLLSRRLSQIPTPNKIYEPPAE